LDGPSNIRPRSLAVRATWRSRRVAHDSTANIDSVSVSKREKRANHDREGLRYPNVLLSRPRKDVQKEAMSLFERIWLSSAQVIAQKRVVFSFRIVKCFCALLSGPSVSPLLGKMQDA
jgi:hypothetical protein